MFGHLRKNGLLKGPFYDDLRFPILHKANFHHLQFAEVTGLKQLIDIFQPDVLLRSAVVFFTRMYNRRLQVLNAI